MSVDLTTRIVKRTRKGWICAWCGEWNEPGKPCWYFTGIWDGDFGACRYHGECLCALKEAARLKPFPYLFEYEAETMARGKPWGRWEKPEEG